MTDKAIPRQLVVNPVLERSYLESLMEYLLTKDEVSPNFENINLREMTYVMIVWHHALKLHE